MQIGIFGFFSIKNKYLFIFIFLYLVTFIFHYLFLDLRIIYLARNGMICLARRFRSKACGVLRKLVNMVGRNLWCYLSLTEREPGGLIKKKPDKDRFHRETIRAISLEYLSRDYFEGGRRRVWKRDRFGVRETRRVCEKIRRVTGQTAVEH